MKTWVIIALFSAFAHATSFVERPFETIVKDAPIIVRGTTGESYADWAPSADGTKRIFTFTPLNLREVLKGDVAKSEILMRQLGGIKDGQGMVLSGTATFRSGQDVVILLGEATPDGSHEVWGLMMGKFDVLKNEAGEESLSGPGIPSGPDTGGIVDDHEHGDAPTKEGQVPKFSLTNLRELIQKQESPESDSNSGTNAGGDPAAAQKTGEAGDKKKSPSNRWGETPDGKPAAQNIDGAAPTLPQGGATGFQVFMVVLALGGILVFVIRRSG